MNLVKERKKKTSQKQGKFSDTHEWTDLID